MSFGVFTCMSYLLAFPYIQQHARLGVVIVFAARLTMLLAFGTLYIYFMEYYPTLIRSTATGTVKII